MQKTTRRMQQIPIRSAVLALFIPLFFAAAVSAQPASEPKTLVAIGASRIYNDLTSAKNAAISEGLFIVVQTAAADVLSISEMTTEFEAVSDLIIRKRNEFIQDYRIIRELRTDKDYRVLVQATILMDRIRQELVTAGIKETPGQLPTVVVMIAEKTLNSRDYAYWWKKGEALFPADTAANAIRTILEQNGLPVIAPDADESGAKGLYDNLELGETPSNYEAARFARRLGADLAIVGTAKVEPSSNRMGENLRTMKAAVDIRVLRADNGEMLTTIREKAATVGENPETAADNALADAARLAGQQLAPQVASLWSKSGAGALTLSVTGKNILPHLERFRQALGNIRGVSSLQTRQMTPNSATLEIEYKGTAQELADTLLLRSYDQFGINITRVSPEGLDIELVSEF